MIHQNHEEEENHHDSLTEIQGGQLLIKKTISQKDYDLSCATRPKNADTFFPLFRVPKGSSEP